MASITKLCIGPGLPLHAQKRRAQPQIAARRFQTVVHGGARQRQQPHRPVQRDAHGPRIPKAEAGLPDQGQRRLGGGVRLFQGQPVFRIQQLLALEPQRRQQRRRIVPQVAEDIAQQHHINTGDTGREPGPA